MRSRGGLSFFDYADFEAVVDRLLADPALRERLVSNGRSYHQRGLQLAGHRGPLRSPGRPHPGPGADAGHHRPAGLIERTVRMSRRGPSSPVVPSGGTRPPGPRASDELAQRLDDIESGLATLHADRYPNGPLYFGDHTALVATRWGAKMLVDTRDAAIAPWIVLDGLWETHVTDWLQQHASGPGRSSSTWGPTSGYFTLLGGQLVGPQGRVVAVEAHAGLAELLRRNVIMNGLYGYVTTWHRAAWSTATQLQLHQRLNFSGASSVGAIGPGGARPSR